MPRLTGENLGKAAVRIQRPLRYIFLEAVLVALGVVLALFAQEWQQGRRDREVARQALTSIHEELNHNHALVQEAFDYHSEKMQLIQGYLARRAEEPDAHPTPSDFPRGFVAPAQLLEVAWITARDVDALSQLPYEDSVDIARIYAEQDYYRIQAERVGELLYRDLYEIGVFGIVEKYPSLASLIGSFLYRERQLLTAYEEALPRVDAMGARLN